MFIFSLVMMAMVAVSVAVFQSYQKSKAIKKIAEDVGFAMNSIAKDVRMGKIETGPSSSCVGDQKRCLAVTRNHSAETVCYKITSDEAIMVYSNDNCTAGGRVIVDLSGTGMKFDLAKSYFYSRQTDTDAPLRGWAELNLDVESPSATTDAIKVQAIVSSRDYGWEDVP